MLSWGFLKNWHEWASLTQKLGSKGPIWRTMFSSSDEEAQGKTLRCALYLFILTGSMSQGVLGDHSSLESKEEQSKQAGSSAQ